MNQSSLHDEIVGQIRDLIFAGEFVGGQRVPEKQLCEQFSVSRTDRKSVV